MRQLESSYDLALWASLSKVLGQKLSSAANLKKRARSESHRAKCFGVSRLWFRQNYRAFRTSSKDGFPQVLDFVSTVPLLAATCWPQAPAQNVPRFMPAPRLLFRRISATLVASLPDFNFQVVVASSRQHIVLIRTCEWS